MYIPTLCSAHKQESSGERKCYLVDGLFMIVLEFSSLNKVKTWRYLKICAKRLKCEELLPFRLVHIRMYMYNNVTVTMSIILFGCLMAHCMQIALHLGLILVKYSCGYTDNEVSVVACIQTISVDRCVHSRSGSVCVLKV